MNGLLELFSIAFFVYFARKLGECSSLLECVCVFNSFLFVVIVDYFTVKGIMVLNYCLNSTFLPC